MKTYTSHVTAEECGYDYYRVYKNSRADGASEDPRLLDAGERYKKSFYRSLGDVSL